MNIKEADITYIFHSSFLVESKNHILIFDYISNQNIDENTLKNKLQTTKKDIYVFVTHSHDDHFDPTIFSWNEFNSNIKYIISDDVFIESHIPNLYYIDKYNFLEQENILIETYGTTDQGLSFLVNVDGLSIYHSGDLNWWHWKNDDNTSQLNEEEDYKKEVDMLQTKDIDIAFVPVDPRLEEYYYLGADYFLEYIKPNLLVPMHFGDKIETSKNLKEKLGDKHLASNLWQINKPLEIYHYKKTD